MSWPFGTRSMAGHTPRQEPNAKIDVPVLRADFLVLQNRPDHAAARPAGIGRTVKHKVNASIRNCNRRAAWIIHLIAIKMGNSQFPNAFFIITLRSGLKIRLHWQQRLALYGALQVHPLLLPTERTCRSPAGPAPVQAFDYHYYMRQNFKSQVQLGKNHLRRG